MPQPPICAGICDSAEPRNRKDRRAGKVLGLAAVRSLFGIEHLREYHLHLVSRGITANSICVKMTALRFFYGTTLRRPDIVGHAGVNMRLNRGGVRELHWHKAAEGAYMLYGNARITAIDAQGRNLVDDVGVGDLWYFPSGIPHSIRG